MDRSTVAGMIDYIKNDEDFNVKSDKDLGLLQTAFVICYMLFAPLFGYLGDRYNRKWILILGLRDELTLCLKTKTYFCDITTNTKIKFFKIFFQSKND